MPYLLKDVCLFHIGFDEIVLWKIESSLSRWKETNQSLSFLCKNIKERKTELMSLYIWKFLNRQLKFFLYPYNKPIISLIQLFVYIWYANKIKEEKYLVSNEGLLSISIFSISFNLQPNTEKKLKEKKEE